MCSVLPAGRSSDRRKSIHSIFTGNGLGLSSSSNVSLEFDFKPELPIVFGILGRRRLDMENLLPAIVSRCSLVLGVCRGSNRGTIQPVYPIDLEAQFFARNVRCLIDQQTLNDIDLVDKAEWNTKLALQSGCDASKQSCSCEPAVGAMGSIFQHVGLEICDAQKDWDMRVLN